MSDVADPRADLDRARERGEISHEDWFVCRIREAGRHALRPRVDELFCVLTESEAEQVIEKQGADEAECVDSVKDAWRALATEAARLEAVTLIDEAADEKAARVKIMGLTSEQRNRVELSRERQAVSAAQKTLRSLRGLLWQLADLRNLLEPVIFLPADIGDSRAARRPADFDSHGHWPILWELLSNQPELSDVLARLSAALENLRAPEKPPKLPRGRRSYPALNRAVLGLGDLLPSTISAADRLRIEHALLFWGGIWPNPDPETLRVRKHELRHPLKPLNQVDL